MTRRQRTRFRRRRTEQQQRSVEMESLRRRMHQVIQRADEVSRRMERRQQPLGEPELAPRQLCDALRDTGGAIQRSMDCLHRSLEDRDWIRDRETEQDLDNLRDHLAQMTDRIEGSVGILERLQQRLYGI